MKTEKQEAKLELELNFVGDGRIFINFWDFKGGDDVVAELKDNKLFLVYENNRETTISEFIKLILESYFGKN